jgi:chaperonin cofactor prefoldin
MANVAELLKRKRTLLERMQEQPDTEQLEKIEHDLKEINDALNRLEAERSDAPPIAPH